MIFWQNSPANPEAVTFGFIGFGDPLLANQTSSLSIAKASAAAVDLLGAASLSSKHALLL